MSQTNETSEPEEPLGQRMTPERHSHLQKIFEGAVHLSAPERSAYLDCACAGDVELRDRLIQLLSADDETVNMEETVIMPEPISRHVSSGVMECPKCWRCYESPLSTCPRDDSTLQFAFAGRQLIDGKYLVERRLGRGGMGAVYLAQHIGLEKRFALKLILQEGALSPFYCESFETEARALGRLSHRNIVQVTDYGVDSRGSGVPYLVMECLAGKTLGQVLKDRRALPFAEAIGLLRATADAVDAAHGNNIVHGDLKPANLFLAQEADSKQTCLKVLDFGLARLTNPLADSDPRQSNQTPVAGSIRGTPAYMAPELFRSEEASPASDRFAFGVLTYELLTGTAPFGVYLAEVVVNIKNPPAPPSSRNSELPADIDAPVLAMLSPNPEDRPPSATAAVSAVAQAWLCAEQRKWRQREWPKRLVLALVASALAVLISAGIAQLRFARSLEGRIADQRFALLPATAPDPSLMLVSIDDATLNADQRPLADRASELATMIESIFTSGAKAVAIDLLLPSRWSESQEFAKAVTSHADRLTLALFSAPSGEIIGTECINRLTALVLGPRRYDALFGVTNLEEDEDRTVRRARLFYIDKFGRRRPSLASRVVEAASPERLGYAPTAVSPICIDYSVRLGSLTSISWKDLPARLSATPELFRNRLVIAGATYSGNGDEHRVPRFASHDLISGQFVQALVVNSILAGNPIREVPLSRCLVAVGLACLATTAAALCFPQRYVASLVASAILLGGYLGWAFWIFRFSRTMIAVAGPELAILLSMLAAWGLKSILSPYPAAEL
jgi:serine/threonine protein kinase/CHASE2 domain-containing sensor protein